MSRSRLRRSAAAATSRGDVIVIDLTGGKLQDN
jgi:hypothetical protein